MPALPPSKPVSESAKTVTSAGALKHVRAATLLAALVPLAHVVATPTPLFAQSGCPSSGGCKVPEGGSIVPMAAAAALFIRHQLKK